MANKIYTRIYDLHIKRFIDQFLHSETIFASEEENKTYIHNYEFGSYREKVIKDYLRTFIPVRLDIGSGFIVNSKNEISGETDIIIYDKQNTPLITDDLNKKIFPAEPVVGIGEAKSVISSEAKLKKILKELSQKKKIVREKNFEWVIHRKPDAKPRIGKNIIDKPFSFLICKKLDFDLDNIENKIVKLYEGINPTLWHNIILSIEDGIIMYEDPEIRMLKYQYPFKEKRMKCLFYRIKDQEDLKHFRSFCIYLNILAFSTSVFRPKLVDYLEGGMTVSQEIISNTTRVENDTLPKQ